MVRPPASSTLFNAYEEDELENGAMHLNSLREVEEEYEEGDEMSDERSRLRGIGNGNGTSNGFAGSRQHSKSPIQTNGPGPRSPQIRSPVNMSMNGPQSAR